MRPRRYIKLLKKNWGEKKFLDPPPRENRAQKRKTRQKWPILGLKRAKYDRKNELLKFLIINSLKGSKTRNLAKNYNFSLIFSQFIGFFRVKKAFFGGLGPISVNIRLFRDKYDIKTPKNHRRLNTGHFLTDICHLGSRIRPIYQIMALECQKLTQNVQR